MAWSVTCPTPGISSGLDLRIASSSPVPDSRLCMETTQREGNELLTHTTAWNEFQKDYVKGEKPYTDCGGTLCHPLTWDSGKGRMIGIEVRWIAARAGIERRWLIQRTTRELSRVMQMFCLLMAVVIPFLKTHWTPVRGEFYHMWTVSHKPEILEPLLPHYTLWEVLCYIYPRQTSPVFMIFPAQSITNRIVCWKPPTQH